MNFKKEKQQQQHLLCILGTSIQQFSHYVPRVKKIGYLLIPYFIVFIFFAILILQ